MVVLGGMGSLWGAVAGAVFLTAVPEFLRAIEDYDILLYGGLLILCMIFLPGGLAEGAERLMRAVRALRPGRGPAASGEVR
jgi:branched-chain amino acid transport system permease protein